MNQLLLGSLLLLAMAQQPAPASGIQFFSLKQDIDMGLAMAADANRTLPLVRTAALESYFRSIGLRLVQASPQDGLRFQFHIVNSTSLNALTFPGGKIYIERALIEKAANEHELAAVLAHEIAHAAARHGTRQLSGQLLVQAPASVLAGLSNDEGWKDQLTQLGISLGARASFLRYSPEQEIEANSRALGILVKAGYSPYALPAILQRINDTTDTEKRSLPAYAYNHPQGKDASKRLETDIAKLKLTKGTLRSTLEFRTFQAALAKLPSPPAASYDLGLDDSELPLEHVHPENYYRIRYPEGWQVRPTSANGAMIAPPTGIQSTAAGDDLRTGVMFDLFPMPEQTMPLDQATNRLIVLLRQRNQELRVVPGAQSQMLMGTEPALRVVMIGGS